MNHVTSPAHCSVNMVSSSFVPSFTVFSLSHCANMFCVRPAAAGADAANALCALLVLPECVGRFRFMVYFCRYYSPRHALLSHTSPQGNHFALTEQITNFVIFRSFHFVSFALTVADGGIPEAAAQHVYYYLYRFYCF